MNRLLDPSKLSNRQSQFAGAVADTERPHDRSGLNRAELQGPSEPKHILPVLPDEIGVDAVASDAIKGRNPPRIKAPVSGAANVGEARVNRYHRVELTAATRPKSGPGSAP